MALYLNWMETTLDDDAFYPFIDTLYDHANFMQSGQRDKRQDGDPIGWADGGSVGIVGAGLSGVLAAYELARAGVRVEIYEASGRVGGRCYSKPFERSDSFGELGAMRFPPSVKIFEYYRKLLKLSFSKEPFPDPGNAGIYTELVYRDKVYEWDSIREKTDPPKPFDRLSKQWEVVSTRYQNMMDRNNLQQAKRNWQATIDKYWDKTFYGFLLEEGFTQEQLIPFGALGIGSGGFGPLYGISALDMIRLIVNGLEHKQRLLVKGISAIPDRLVRRKYNPEGHSLHNQGSIHFQCRVTSVSSERDNGVVLTLEGQGHRRAEQVEHDAVIFATGNRAMQMADVASILHRDGSLADVAVRTLHNTSSSKVFYRTNTQFWKDSSNVIPSNIQTDGLIRGLYCLSYPNRDDGIVLISYTWEDSSIKLEGLADIPKEGLQDDLKVKLLQELKRHNPKFYHAFKEAAGNSFDLENFLEIAWQEEPDYYGAFKLFYPGQDQLGADLYYDFQKVDLDPDCPKVYVAGDAVSFTGGWVAGAIETGLNAAVAALRAVGGRPRHDSPLTMEKHYHYTKRQHEDN